LCTLCVDKAYAACCVQNQYLKYKKTRSALAGRVASL
jgi:hypothetical protein